MFHTLGVVGVGMVGGAVKRYYESKGTPIFAYDKFKNLGSVEEVNKADIIYICVPTPHKDDGGFDLSFVEEAVRNIFGSKTIVLKSTILPGTTERFQMQFPQHRFLFNPEFLTQSTADNDMSFPDRQIVGYTNQSFTVAGTVMELLPLAPFERIVPATEAEMVKYFGNTWFSAKVVFANQMYDLCQKLGIDYDRVKDSVAADKRIGRSHLDVMHGGYRGYGGACLPKDTRSLIQFGEALGVDLKLLKTVEEINNELRASQRLDADR
ncbi:hypothetical protein A3F28_02090 [Candidatus Uhrbacteria bacterium RIFCSPHIGHO2_12_FULL_57_11]|uniref:UDP-glucose/GDP-mannose dehydrogenase dimerisation domain-containing protein n=1 Tax=Candidatus Uhrbacteria bacterium RIFCSPHIGHO2_12_FULL_57_11 TaxID=1802398 RepID=A0A1F7ULS9_9BACT|nr:MAG: hypothetical protein A3F28_02090 [Candidatus Uhrbacteria bacterium RIFCSPHIGHO2_12_FULL_57_11]